jgi:SAM-dependent methyltransferase
MIRRLRRAATGLRHGINPLLAMKYLRWPADNRFHSYAEPAIDGQWRDIIWPLLARHGFDLARVLDFACGRGRNTRKFLEAGAQHVSMVDIDPSNIAVCSERSADDHRVRVLPNNNGRDLSDLESESFATVYSWDAMVHFEPALIRRYMTEFARVLRPGGKGFLHHSNAASGGRFRANREGRTAMSAQLMHDFATAAELRVIEQEPLDWGGMAKLDCISIVERQRNLPARHAS